MKRGLVDLRSILWTSLMFGKDQEFGRIVVFENKEVSVNSYHHGYENAVQYLCLVMEDLHLQPRDLIFVDDGNHGKATREFLFPGYKAGREQAPEIYEQFQKAKEKVLDAFLNLGAQLAWQDNLEADDVIGYLAQNLKGERYIISNDGDLAVLVNPKAGIHHWKQAQLDKNPFGPFDHQYIMVYKALVGDPSDKYPGAKGFGGKAFEKLLGTFGDAGLAAMDELIRNKQIPRLAEDVAELKELQKVIDNAESVYTCYELARLMVEKCNTLRKPLQWRAGMVKDISSCEDERLRKFAGQVRLVHAGNYEEAKKWAKAQIGKSPFVSLDIETSTPPESDEWIRLQNKEEGSVVDVFGSELTGLGMTFGPNCQYTFYLTHDHVEQAEVNNLTVDQVRDFVDMVPRETVTVVHNSAFELPVLYCTWGEDWKDDPDYHGFLRNIRDSRILSSYVDENRKAGLKSLSEEVLGYQQTSYQEVTTMEGPRGTLPPSQGEVIFWEEPITDAEGNVQGYTEMERRQYKMNELSAKRVLSYGADDCICTAALWTHFRIIAEIENTFHVFEEVETFPAYLTALAFVQGVDFSAEEMLRLSKEDDEAYDKAWAVLRQYLMEKHWEGVVCPIYEEFTPAAIKEGIVIVAGQEYKSRLRTVSKMAKELREVAEEWDNIAQNRALIIAKLIEASDIDGFNRMVKDHFDGEPKIDLASPKQVAHLVYDVMGMPVKIINDTTPLEKKNDPDLAAAVRKFKRIRAGETNLTMTDDEMKLVRRKAKADDTAIEFGIAFDLDKLGEKEVAALKAIGQMKTVMTRRSLFYKNYQGIRHWKDGKIHAHINQCGTVTRRYSSSKPNLQQLPKKGEGVKFRGCFKPHHRDAVVCSIDFSGQELRLAAWASQDKNMLSCYIGDHLRDIHSITASGAMKLKWGNRVVQECYAKWSKEGDDDYSLFLKLRALGKADPMGKKADDLRKDSKNVNFAAQFGGRAPKLSETLIMPLEDAQLFLDARNKMFPDVDKAAEKSADLCKRTGYALTMMGARRHLREGISSSDKGAVERAARQSWNMEIQGSAAEMTKLAMARFWKSGVLWKYDVRFIAPIHDELVTSIHKDHVLAVVKVKHDCMVQPYAGMEVPILGSISIGPDFAHQHECGDWYIRENIKAALSDIYEKKVLS